MNAPNELKNVTGSPIAANAARLSVKSDWGTGQMVEATGATR